jgi:Tol biopolymer transport system component/tRNA A-37 threonylcarbamoyl transferase component Bud32
MGDLIGQPMGSYRLTRLLGRGGFAEVYLGEHRYLGSQAAVKVLPVQAYQEQRELILKEARTSASLDHPHIARMLEFGFQEATPYMVMPYASGGTLRTRHPRGTILSFERIVFYTMQIAEALQYAHDQKVLHRDVKPENVLLGPGNELLLGDFGIAVVAHKTESMSEQGVAGTSVYMAPEQARGRARPASDQYALAVVVYEWIRGTPPFKGTPIEVALKHLFDQPPALKKKAPLGDNAEEYTRQVLMKALAKDPHRRFPSVLAFACALEEISRGYKPGIGTTQTLYRKHSSIVYALAWSPDGTRIASGSVDATAQIWDARTGRTCRCYLEHDRCICGVSWSPDGRRIASASDDSTVKVWDARSGGHLFTYQGHGDYVGAVAWSPDGTRIVSSSWDRSVQIWDARTGGLHLAYHGHDPGGENALAIKVLAWSPDGTRIASGGDDQTIQVWDAQTGQQLVTYRGHTVVNAAQWSPDGTCIASCGEDQTVQVWDAQTGQQLVTYREHSQGGVNCLAWSPDGTRIASGGDDSVQVWQVQTGKAVFRFYEHRTYITAVAWSPDGTRIASASADGVVRVWQAEQPEPW